MRSPFFLKNEKMNILEPSTNTHKNIRNSSYITLSVLDFLDF